MSDETRPEMTQLEKDREWREQVYQGDAPQLTPRALVTGLMLGWLMALSNLYVGLKSGWGLGVEITAIVLGFAIWKVIQTLRLSRRPLGMLENNIIMTSAVAPSYITSAGLVAAIPAMWMLDPDFSITWWQLGIWMSTILFLGLMVSIPIKRQVVNTGELRFPAVVPAAETLKSMYSHGTEALHKATSLGIAGVIGVVTKILTERAIVPALSTFTQLRIAGIGLPKLTLFIETSWIFVGFGAFIGTRVGITMIVGALLNYAVLGPWMIHEKEIRHAPPTLHGAQALVFPLTLPAGSELRFELEQANVGPELADGMQTLQLGRVWKEKATYASPDELIAALNETDGGAAAGLAPLAPTLHFEMPEVGVTVGEEKHRPVSFLPFELTRPVIRKEKELRVSAPEAIGWEARLAVVPAAGAMPGTDAAALLGFAPDAEDVQTVGSYRNIVAWTMWPGVGMMVIAGLLAFAFQWRTIANAFRGFVGTLGNRGASTATADEDPLADIEIPMSWFLAGFTLFGILAVIVMDWLFSIPLWMGVIAVILSFFLAIVSIRASGETGIIPIGAMGKVTQLTFGVLHPGNMKTNLMTANVTAGAATSASDMTNQLKVGHMIGAKARLQFIAQLFGIVCALGVIPVFFIMVPDASAIGTQELPAPAAIVWAGVARLLSQGLGSLPPTAVKALVVASLLGAAITVLERLYPKAKGWVWLPSPAGLGIAMTVPALYSISMFFGAMIALVLSKAAKATHEMYTIPVASGFIAGESLTGVFFAIAAALGG
jgi:uncharacterized oligopeptide transporter (OPT) family protein